MPLRVTPEHRGEFFVPALGNSGLLTVERPKSLDGISVIAVVVGKVSHFGDPLVQRFR